MLTNYSSTPTAITARSYYWRNRKRVLGLQREKYANDAAYRAQCKTRAIAWRNENNEYALKLDSLRHCIAYHLRKGNVARANELKAEKRLLQMSLANRSKPIEYVR